MGAAPLSRPQRASFGFTLQEVLVALAVLSLLLLGLIQGSHFVLLGWNMQSRLVARTQDLDAVDRTLRRLIVQAKPGSKWEPLTFAGSARSAAFTTIVPLPANNGPANNGPSAQRADVALVVDGHRLLLRWTPHIHAIRIGPSLPASTTELLDGVDRLELSYWPASHGGGWTSSWNDSIPPRLVRLRIVFSSPSQARWPDILAAPMLEPP
jgi:general secretion pathway protein J